ncbi:MAG: hypothetical protein OSB00_13780 [Sphingomonas bacterium]|nr:hypothetical protein [Sphingomonas bacterium]
MGAIGCAGVNIGAWGGAMDTIRRLSLNHRMLMLALVALALAVRALVPGGWMVMPAADGAVRLTICTGTGPVEMTMPMTTAGQMSGQMSGMPHHGDTDGAPSHPDRPCAFVGLGLASDLPTIDLPAAPARIIDRAAPGLAAIATIGHGLAAPPPPQTGPPAFV